MSPTSATKSPGPPSPGPSRAEVRGATIVEALRANGRDLPDRPAMSRRVEGRWEALTWAEYNTAVGELVAGLADLGLNLGDRAAILSNNRLEWHLADQAILANGSVTVPVYQTSSADQITYILGHSGSRVCFVEDQGQLTKVMEVRSQLPRLEHVVQLEGTVPPSENGLVISLEELRAQGRARLAREPGLFDERASAVAPDHLATLVYTSGTTGRPKGTMITHGNIMWTLRGSTSPFEIRPGERLLSFLPLSHIAERMMSDFLPIAVGGETWFARSLATVAEDLRDCRPTVFLAVPRVWEKLRGAVLDQLKEKPAPMRLAVAAYVRSGWRGAGQAEGGRASRRLAAGAHRALDRVIGAKLRAALGLDAAHVFITAAAPIHPDLIRWFHAVGIPLVELYGQTEGCGPTTTNLPWNNKIGTVGPAIPGVTVRIADDDEILVKGGNVCAGYYEDPVGSAELIDPDGWMHTGDLGALDDDGFLTITGRKKDLIINAAGKNISPQNIELDLRNHGLISQAVVIGDGRRYLTALVTLNAEQLKLWAGQHHKVFDPEALLGDPDVLAEVQRAIDEVNIKRSRVESVRKFRVLPRDLTVAEGELTPTLKPKRFVVNQRYADLVEEMYADEA
ncbi:MAG: long-chain fatty acid--CoA ligase [Acidimicrobiales bacterium]